MKSNKRKLHIDVFLLTMSYAFLFVIWYHSLSEILLPYKHTILENRPSTGFFVRMQNFVQMNTWFILIPLLLLIAANVYLLWHRIEKRKQSVDHVVQHTYVTNYGYIILKSFCLFVITLLPDGRSLTETPILFEIYITTFVHTTFIALLFLVHHKNITFSRKKARN